jgi:hypothetical protein
MFLYARLVIANLNGQPTFEEIQQEADNLPDSLREMQVHPSEVPIKIWALNRRNSYGRMLARITKALSPAERNKVKRIFSWLVCARRPLRTIELEHALLIRTAPEESNRELHRARKLIKDMRELCGPIIENRGTYIAFVHFSAKE